MARGTMMTATIWSFLQDPENRAVLGWLASGAGVAACAMWAVIKFVYKSRASRNSPTHVVSGDRSGVAVGRDIRDSTIETGHRPHH
jgi:hypothetical protein